MSRLREEAGMTIMEVLTACTVGLIVLGAMFTLLDSTVRMNTGVMSKTDAMQRGRLAMDVMTQELRSQVCLENLAGPAIVPGATADTVEFYSDFSDGTGDVPPTKRRLAYDPATGNIQTKIYTTAKLEPTPGDFAGAQAITQMRMEKVKRALDDAGNPVPFLRYYAYQWVDAAAGTKRPEATLELLPPIDANEARRVARIDVSFSALPLGAKDKTKGVDLTDRVMARHSDPNLAKWDPVNPTLPDPRCV